MSEEPLLLHFDVTAKGTAKRVPVSSEAATGMGEMTGHLRSWRFEEKSIERRPDDIQ